MVAVPQTPRRLTLTARKEQTMTEPRPTHREATDIVQNDDALLAAGSADSDPAADDDAATDDDARTADTSPVGDVKTD